MIAYKNKSKNLFKNTRLTCVQANENKTFKDLEKKNSIQIKLVF